MSNFNTLEEGTSYTNHKGESILVKQLTHAPYPALKGTIDGAYTDEGWMSIEAIYNFANN